jgi:hypothetical protein
LNATARLRPQRGSIALAVRLIVLGTILGATACVRGVAVTPPPTPVYAVSVRNATDTEIIVSYADGTANRALGTVLPGDTERFVIAAPASTTVEIHARTAGGGPLYGPFRVSLVAGTTVPVTIR